MYSLYIVEAERSKHIKIGISDDPKKRLRQLQTANHEKLVLLYVVKLESKEAAQNLEEHLHEKYAKHKVHLEWFALKAGEVYMYIETLRGLSHSLLIDVKAKPSTAKTPYKFSSHMMMGVLLVFLGSISTWLGGLIYQDSLMIVASGIALVIAIIGMALEIKLSLS